MKKLLLFLLFLPFFGFGQCLTGDCKEGYGTYMNDGGDVYVGSFRNSSPHGQGVYTKASQNQSWVYTGSFENGNKYGQGTCVYSQAWCRTYTGEWANNHWSQGVLTLTNGDIYSGEFKASNFHGQGTYTYANGDKYVGEWKENKSHGQGTYTWPDGSKYVGEWKDNERSGEGTNYWKEASEYHNMPADSKYEGQWLNNKKHGYGKATYADGTVREGLWKNGEFIK